MSPNRYSEPDEDAIDEHPPDDAPVEEQSHECRKGWLSKPDADHPVPCLICKPHLAPENRVHHLGQ